MFSIVIPCFNHAQTLERAVLSCLEQSDLSEVVIVDDCSKDDSFEVMRTLAQRHEKLSLHRMPTNSGPAAARNAGVALTTGKYVVFLDADDEFLGDFSAAARKIFEAEPLVQVVKCDFDLFDPIKGYVLPDYDVRYLSVVLSSAWGMAISREAFSAIGGFPEAQEFKGDNGGEDVAFMQAVIRHFQPIRRVNTKLLRVWSKAGSHHDRFLANTRLVGDSFEFVRLHPDQQPAGILERTMENYLAEVERRLKGK